MNLAILIVASTSLVCSSATLVIMASVALEAKKAKTNLEAELELVRAKVNKNTRVVQAALQNLDLEL